MDGGKEKKSKDLKTMVFVFTDNDPVLMGDSDAHGHEKLTRERALGSDGRDKLSSRCKKEDCMSALISDNDITKVIDGKTTRFMKDGLCEIFKDDFRSSQVKDENTMMNMITNDDISILIDDNTTRITQSIRFNGLNER